ncbi:acetolactate synthase large subunit [Rhizobium alvei]
MTEAPSEMMNGAESLVRTLVNCGVDLCIGNAGTSEMHFVSALDRVPGMRAVLGLFEGVVTGAADGYARMAQKPAATLLHLGPGLANGLANLHNARKAQAPVVNIIGDHATSHQRYDAPLSSDVEAFAATVSHWVHSSREARNVAADAARAVQAARQAPGQIASLILPADTAWSPALGPAGALPVLPPAPVSSLAIATAATAIRKGKAALLMRGALLHGAGLKAAGRIAAATGTRLMADTFAPRIRRGAGEISVERIPYRPGPALDFMAGIETLILVGTQAPVGFFAYPGQPSEFTPPGVSILQLAHPHEDGGAALEELASLLAGSATARTNPLAPPAAPQDGTLTRETLMAIVAGRLPEEAIVVDESITGAFGLYGMLETAAPFDCLQLTGGAIGDGLPMATGAALACPDRKVVTLQADGSAMYTLQALWTQARENLDVVTIIYANRSYKILVEEMKGVGAEIGKSAASLFDLANPALDWVRLAEGMGVEATRAETVAQFDSALTAALKAKGPRLIEAVIG